MHFRFTKDDALNLNLFVETRSDERCGMGNVNQFVYPLVMNANWVLGADIVPPAKPARRLSAHVPS